MRPRRGRPRLCPPPAALSRASRECGLVSGFIEVFGARSLPEALCLAHSVTPGILGEDVPLRPLGGRCVFTLLLLGARLGVGSCCGQSQAAPGAGGERWATEGGPGGGVRGGEAGAAGQSRSRGLTPSCLTHGRQRHKRAGAEGPLRAPDGNPGPGHLHPGAASPEQTLHWATPTSLHQSFPGVRPGLRRLQERCPPRSREGRVPGRGRPASVSGSGEGGARGDSRPSVSLCSPSPTRCAPPKASSLTCCEFPPDF